MSRIDQNESAVSKAPQGEGRDVSARRGADIIDLQTPRKAGYSHPQLEVVNPDSSAKSLTPFSAARSDAMPWTGLFRALRYNVDSQAGGAGASSAPAHNPAQRFLEEQWGTFLRGQRVVQGHPLEQLYRFDIVVPDHSARVLATTGRESSTALHDISQLINVLRPLAVANPNVPAEAVALLDRFQERIRPSGLKISEFARELDLRPELLQSGRIAGAAVTETLAGAISLVNDQLRNGAPMYTPVLAGLPTPGLSDEKLNRTLRHLGVYVGGVQRMSPEVKGMVGEISALFVDAKSLIDRGGSSRQQAHVSRALDRFHDDVLSLSAQSRRS